MYRSHPVMFRDQPFRFVLLAALIPVFGIGAIFLLIWYVQAKCTLFEIEAGRVRCSAGVFNKNRIDISTSSIRSVGVRQTLLQRLLGTGDVLIFTAGDAPEVVAAALPDPHEVRRMLDQPTKQGKAS